MTVHPRNINRRRREQRYVFVHRSADLARTVRGITWKDGVSAPLPAIKAATVAASMGGQIRYGYCIDEPNVFGDPTDEERAAALEAGGGAAPPATRLKRLMQRFAVVMEDPELEHDENMLSRLDAMSDEEQQIALDEFEQGIADMEAELAETAKVEAEAAAAEADAEVEEALPFVDETMPPPSKEEPLLVSVSSLRSMTKAQLDSWAQVYLGKNLDTTALKSDMIEEILADPRVQEEASALVYDDTPDEDDEE